MCFLKAMVLLSSAVTGVLSGIVPSTMRAMQASGTPCEAPWPCLALNPQAKVPSPGVGQVLVRMFGSSVNPLDVDLVEPRCKAFPPGLFGCSNGTIGDEGAGVVVATGKSCEGLSPGDEVWGSAKGAYAEYALGICALTRPKPKSLSFLDAGTIPGVGLTSLTSLQRTGAPWENGSNVTVVVTSGQGGTGFIGVQLAKKLGAARVITAATGGGIEMVKSLGADIVVDYQQQELFDALQDNSVDVVYDNIGLKGTADKAMRAIRTGGIFLLLEGGGGGELSQHPKDGVRQVKFSMKPSAKGLDTLARWFDDGFLRPHTMGTYALTEVPEAFTRALGHGVLGKIAVAPSRERARSAITILA